MSKFTTEDKKIIKEKLNYVGIDLGKIPEIIKKPIPIEIKETLEKENRVYKYVPIEKIQIWITMKNRSLPFREKIKNALPLYEYLNPNEDEEMENYAELIRMLNLTSKDEIEEIDKAQKNYLKNIPFEVKFEKSFLWQIYYSASNDLYYMLIPRDNAKYNEMFYIIKKQLENKTKKKSEKIYVPICNLDFESNIIRKQECADIEKYLWVFTKEWPNIYEVYDEDDMPSIQITGETPCFDKIMSKYKKVLETSENANEFYKFVKALFILQTEMNYYYFNTKINENGEIVFYYKNSQIIFEDLPQFIKNEYVNFCNMLNTEQEEKRKLRTELNELKLLTNNLEKEYLIKQREIATYLEYKKSFLGRIRLFLKPKIVLKKENKNEENSEIKEEKENLTVLKLKTEKANYTIEDLIDLFKRYKKESNIIKNLKSDIEALKNKNKMLKKKNENATLYINEINEHKKSIFEFWKFTNKDEKLVLEEGIEQEKSENKIKKAFDYNLDINELGIVLDKIQRKNLSKEEQDAVFLTGTEILSIMNLLKLNKDENVETEVLKLREKLLEKNQNESIEKFDIFGYVTEDRGKLKELANQKHRETEKNENVILEINKEILPDKLLESIKLKQKEIENALKKVYVPVELYAYKIINKSSKLEKNELAIFNLDEIQLVENCDLEKFKLIKILLKENMPAVFFTNIIYYNNKNGTLPIGMNVEKKLLINCSAYEFKLKNSQTITRINKSDEIQKFEVEEYELEFIDSVK